MCRLVLTKLSGWQCSCTPTLRRCENDYNWWWITISMIMRCITFQFVCKENVTWHAEIKVPSRRLRRSWLAAAAVATKGQYSWGAAIGLFLAMKSVWLCGGLTHPWAPHTHTHTSGHLRTLRPQHAFPFIFMAFSI